MPAQHFGWTAAAPKVSSPNPGQPPDQPSPPPRPEDEPPRPGRTPDEPMAPIPGAPQPPPPEPLAPPTWDDLASKRNTKTRKSENTKAVPEGNM